MTALLQSSAEPAKILSNAVLKAARILDIRQALLAKVLGISAPTASRLFNGSYTLSVGRKKEWELAVLFIRVFRSLDALVGNSERAKEWLRGYNTGLNAKPIDLLIKTEGMVHVLNYLDAYRGRI